MSDFPAAGQPELSADVSRSRDNLDEFFEKSSHLSGLNEARQQPIDVISIDVISIDAISIDAGIRCWAGNAEIVIGATLTLEGGFSGSKQMAFGQTLGFSTSAKNNAAMAESHITGCVLGTAVGDALGLPYESVSRQRQPRLLGLPDRHRFVFGRGMVSDDTEHTCLVMQALITSGLSPHQFGIDFSKRLKRWLVLLPAGVGKATLRSCLKLCCGFPPEKSGVFSAGNGPAMRAAIFGAVFDDLDQMLRFVRVSTRITHTDPKAEHGAIAVAIAANWQRRHGTVVPAAYVETVAQYLEPEAAEFIELLQQVAGSVERGEATAEFATGIGLSRGVSGFTYHTVPVAVHAWMLHPADYKAAVTSVIGCGGDADTTAAIVGGIVGASVGEQGIPPDLVSGIIEWPRTVKWMRQLAQQLHKSYLHKFQSVPASTDSRTAPQLNAVAELFRNLIFLAIVLVHGIRRLLPPY